MTGVTIIEIKGNRYFSETIKNLIAPRAKPSSPSLSHFKNVKKKSKIKNHRVKVVGSRCQLKITVWRTVFKRKIEKAPPPTP